MPRPHLTPRDRALPRPSGYACPRATSGGPSAAANRTSPHPMPRSPRATHPGPFGRLTPLLGRKPKAVPVKMLKRLCCDPQGAESIPGPEGHTKDTQDRDDTFEVSLDRCPAYGEPE